MSNIKGRIITSQPKKIERFQDVEQVLSKYHCRLTKILLLSGIQIMENNKCVQRWVGKSVWCKKYQDFGENIFLLSILWGLHPFSSNLWADKWDLREEYGGTNFGEKGFQLFQLLQYRKYGTLTNHIYIKYWIKKIALFVRGSVWQFQKRQ